MGSLGWDQGQEIRSRTGVYGEAEENRSFFWKKTDAKHVGGFQ